MHRTRARVPMTECGSAPRLTALPGYDRWAEPALINNTLVALLHNPRPLVAFAVHERDAMSHPLAAIQPPLIIDNRTW